MNITVAGVGYVGLAQAVLLAQHNAVTAVTTTPAKAEQINRGISPIADAEIRSRTSCSTFLSTSSRRRSQSISACFRQSFPLNFADRAITSFTFIPL